MKILLLEDDTLLSEVITEQLEYYHYQITPAFTGSEAEEIFYKEQFDLLLLDVNVPGISGFEFLEEIRQLGKHTPAIFITSMNTPADLLKGFEIGANDYLKKPFDMVELIARIENIKRHFHINTEETYQLTSNIHYNHATHLLLVDSHEERLSNKEAEILHYLIQHQGKVITQEELSLNVWSYEEQPTAATIRSYIKKLRKILGSTTIETIRGVGYRLNT